MKTFQNVVDHFGSKANLARALGVSAAAITQWGEEFPELRAHQIQTVTRGKFRFCDLPVKVK